MPHCDSDCQNCQLSTKCDVFQTLDELDFERGIWAAAQSGDLQRLTILIGKGEDVNVTDSAGYTALHYAARNGHLEVCKHLLMNHADINAITKAGCATALHRACSAGMLDIVKLLLQHNANPDLKDSDGKTALHRAAEKQNIQICEILLCFSPNLKKELDNKNKLAMDYANGDVLNNFLKC